MSEQSDDMKSALEDSMFDLYLFVTASMQKHLWSSMLYGTDRASHSRTPVVVRSAQDQSHLRNAVRKSGPSREEYTPPVYL